MFPEMLVPLLLFVVWVRVHMTPILACWSLELVSYFHICCLSLRACYCFMNDVIFSGHSWGALCWKTRWRVLQIDHWRGLQVCGVSKFQTMIDLLLKLTKLLILCFQGCCEMWPSRYCWHNQISLGQVSIRPCIWPQQANLWLES